MLNYVVHLLGWLRLRIYLINEIVGVTYNSIVHDVSFATKSQLTNYPQELLLPCFGNLPGRVDLINFKPSKHTKNNLCCVSLIMYNNTKFLCGYVFRIISPDHVQIFCKVSYESHGKRIRLFAVKNYWFQLSGFN